MSSAETVNQATITSDARFGILSKSGSDAKKMFTDKVVPISVNYPFFFKPIQDGMDRPKSELAYRVPAAKLTRRVLESKTLLLTYKVLIQPLTGKTQVTTATMVKNYVYLYTMKVVSGKSLTTF